MRSIWKPIISPNNIRAKLISPDMIGKVISLKNAKEIKITVDHVGHKIGEFFKTKKNVKHKVYKKAS